MHRIEEDFEEPQLGHLRGMHGVVGNGAGHDLPRLLPATGPGPGVRCHTRIYGEGDGGVPARGIPVVGWLSARQQLVELAPPLGRQLAPIRPRDRYEVASIRLDRILCRDHVRTLSAAGRHNLVAELGGNRKTGGRHEVRIAAPVLHSTCNARPGFWRARRSPGSTMLA